MRRFIVFALLCLPTALASQQADRTISPGMTRAQVVAVLGAPTTQRTASEFTYMFYPNSCGRSCGMNDLVILRHDSVTDAIFRSPSRHYSGTSSSPEQSPPQVATRPARTTSKSPSNSTSKSASKATSPPTTAVRKDEAPAPKPAAPAPLKPPAKPTDATPSIPLKQKPLEPAPTKTTAPAKTTTPAKSTTPPAKAPAPAKTTAPDKKTSG
jgi:hypothetical protein